MKLLRLRSMLCFFSGIAIIIPAIYAQTQIQGPTIIQTSGPVPAGANRQVQVNNAGVLGGTNVTVDASGNVLSAPVATASVNKVINVMAPPYNVASDCITDNHAAIQQAFTDSLATNAFIYFPATESGCFLTDTVTIMGQSFGGAGKGITKIKGLPGKHVFATPDSHVSLLPRADIGNFSLLVDNTVNAASSVVGGNNTYPNQISGTAGGTTPLAAPPAPAGMAFGNYGTGSCYGSMANGSTTFTMSCANFTQIDPQFFVGQTVSIPASSYSATIMSVLGTSTLQLSGAWSGTTSSTLAGTISGTKFKPPWYFGNCGIALPATSGANMATNYNGWVFHDLDIENTGGNIWTNYSCAIFQQAAPNKISFINVETTGLWGGIIEAPPTSNNTSYYAWTPDTNLYQGIDSKWDAIPMVWYNGNHRVANGLNFYTGTRPFALGMWSFSSALGSSGSSSVSATINQYYDECFTPNSGEHARFSGITNINGGSLMQCYGTLTTTFATNQSAVDAQIGASGPVVTGNQNVFKSIANGSYSDLGIDNSIQTGVNQSVPSRHRNYFLNRPRDPGNKLDGGFLLSGNGSTPYTSSNDLMVTCPEFNFAFQNGSNSISGCTNDPAGMEITQSYANLQSANYSSFSLSYTSTSQGSGPYGKLIQVGDRWPQSSGTLVVTAFCDVACTAAITVRDATTSTTLASSALSFGTTPTTRTFSVDLSTANIGDGITINGTGLFSAGNAHFKLALIGFSPTNNATLAAAVSDPRVTGLVQGSLPGNDVLMSPCNLNWYTMETVPPPCAADSKSPYTQVSRLIASGTQSQATGYGSIVQWGSGGAGKTIPAIPISIQVTAYSGSSVTQTVRVLCNGSTLSGATVNASWTTSASSINVPMRADLCNVSPYNIGIQFDATTDDVHLGSIAWHYAQPDAFSTASGQVRSTTLINGVYYDLPNTLSIPPVPLAGTTGSIGGSALTAGGCASGTATITGATTSMVPKSSPNTYPGDGMVWESYMSAANTVTVKVCAVTAGTPAASTYNVRVIQ